jgi:TatD DNase family protein
MHPQLPQLIDTHAHLDDEKLRDDLPAVLERARQAGVFRIVTIATTAASTRACLEIAGSHDDQVHASAGIHPNSAAEAGATDWDQVARLAAKTRVVAIGETGLDRHWDFTPFAVQEDYFARHLALSRRLHKPIVIHCREADGDVLRMLQSDFNPNGPILGVMHSFSGDEALAQACVEMGLYISFAGMLTYKNAESLRQVAAKIPGDRLLVETDSPYLAPVPKRGQRNEPANVVHTATCLAAVRGLPGDELAGMTTANAQQLFFSGA